MPVPDDPPQSDSIWSSKRVWDFEASPETLDLLSRALRDLAAGASGADEMVDSARREVDSQEDWAGDTADTYQSHARKLTDDLADLSETVTGTADTLDAVAATLRDGQAQLNEIRIGLAGIPATESEAGTRFQPRDDAERARVRDAIEAAGQVRASVDEQFVLHESAFHRAKRDLAPMLETWKPRNLRVLDMNVGMGYKNSLFNDKGTDVADMDVIGEIIKNSDADIVTLQEVFQTVGLDKLQDWLDEHTDGEWEVHFAAADHKIYAGDSVWDDYTGTNDEFGNAVLVRKGTDIADSDETGETTLQRPGHLGIFNVGEEGRSMEQVQVDLQ
jgi:uncharacterized protein YukE